ncbi:MAG: hypothetical protein U1F43_29295 [Myxococcota bacterium]
MRRTRLALSLTSTLAGLALALVSACSDEAEPDPNGDCPEPAYGGKASDEAWRAILDALPTAEVGSPHAVTLTSPTEGAVLSADGGPPTFAWTSPIALDIAPSGRVPRHLPPITDDIYYVQIGVAGEDCAIEALTTELGWTPDAAAWAKLQAAAGKALTLTVTSAYLQENVVAEGPYQLAAPLHFSLE